MKSCPNRNSPEWKILEEKIGLFEAMKDFMEQNEKVRSLEEILRDKPDLEYLYSLKKDEPIANSSAALFNNQLKDHLIRFLKGLNIDVFENADDYLNNLPFDKGNARSGFDVIQKFLALRSDITDDDLAMQTAAIIYTFLGRKSRLGRELWINIKQWSKYKDLYNFYAELPKSELYDESETWMDDLPEDVKFTKPVNVFAHKQVIIHLIANMIRSTPIKDVFKKLQQEEGNSKTIENPDLDKDYFEKFGFRNIYEEDTLKRIFNKIINFIREYVFGVTPVKKDYTEKELLDTVSDIVDTVFKLDYQLFLKGIKKEGDLLYFIKDGKREYLELKDYDKTLDADPEIKKIVNRLLNNYTLDYKLSGSQVLRKYGTLFRSLVEDLHDIDGVIPVERFMQEQNALQTSLWIQNRGLELVKQGRNSIFKKEFTPYLEQMSWYREIQNMFPTWELEKTFIGKDHKEGESVTITGTINHPTKIDPKTGKKAKITLDFFLRISDKLSVLFRPRSLSSNV
jgi:hypothetical protein